MIALIEIPHQRPARINWYDNRQSLIDDATEKAIESGREEPEDFADAVYSLADDWNSHILVQSDDDIPDVEHYTGHQQLKVRALVPQLKEAMCNQNHA